MVEPDSNLELSVHHTTGNALPCNNNLEAIHWALHVERWVSGSTFKHTYEHSLTHLWVNICPHFCLVYLTVELVGCMVRLYSTANTAHNFPKIGIHTPSSSRIWTSRWPPFILTTWVNGQSHFGELEFRLAFPWCLMRLSTFSCLLSTWLPLLWSVCPNFLPIFSIWFSGW